MENTSVYIKVENGLYVFLTWCSWCKGLASVQAVSLQIIAAARVTDRSSPFAICRGTA